MDSSNPPTPLHSTPAAVAAAAVVEEHGLTRGLSREEKNLHSSDTTGERRRGLKVRVAEQRVNREERGTERNGTEGLAGSAVISRASCRQTDRRTVDRPTQSAQEPGDTAGAGTPLYARTSQLLLFEIQWIVWFGCAVMDSPPDLFSDSAPKIHAFASTLSSSDLSVVHPEPSAGRPPPAFRPPVFPLIHHLHQPGGASRRIGGQLGTSPSTHRHLEERNLEEGGGEKDGQVEQGSDGGEEGALEGEEGFLEVKKRHSALTAEWSQDILKVKRMKLESRQRDGEADEGGVRREIGREGRRREREELKEQLEEARERLQVLQEKVWRAFGEKHLAEEEEKKRRHRGGNRGAAEGGDGDMGMMEEADITEGMYDDDDIDDGEIEKESFSFLSVSPFDNFHKQREERQKEREERMERGRGGGLHVEGLMEGAGLWLDCGGLVRGDWDGGIQEEGEEGGQKFAQALKLELGSAVARVIDRVLRLYTETEDLAPSSPPAAISFHPSDVGNDGGREKGEWTGLLASGRGKEKTRGKEEKMGGQDREREKQLRKMRNGNMVAPGQSHRADASDLANPLAAQRSPDPRKAHALLGPPLSSHMNPSHPNLSMHHASLPRPPPPLSHPSLLPPASQPKDPSSSSSSHPSSSSSSASSSSFPVPPPPPPPLPLPLLHYSMQQLFSRALHHPQLPHLPPPRKDFLSSDPFLEFSSHPSSHPSFPPLPLLGHLDPSLARHALGGRERGVRGDGGMRGGGGMDGGELYLTAGGIQEGLSPCHLKKAKLMFFYARYPSSNTLKTFFPDVKFNRCVTSQMIKWFSNFREFFYIQMERFARQAVREALTRDGAPRLGRESQLRVGRDTELYRILNMHYNKSNIYQVPDRFIEVSEVALREFYAAIWTGRDSDPCWKKGIYKIICKLDSPVPDAFRLPGCPVG
ncbi:prospero homeobox 3 isoform X2 [Solea solea]|uniref:prospero homeobox 3 isoform X2 n=1 Tax=Solea solea TaxID=90069 RepID=UPI00272C6692|nr:prospero homeobox 3 isoform X2 [Solea solea]